MQKTKSQDYVLYIMFSKQINVLLYLICTTYQQDEGQQPTCLFTVKPINM